MSEPVGVAKGPGETAHEYTFISADCDQRLKNGEFVYYVAPTPDGERRILGRITRREPVKLFPDSFLADPSLPPDDIARAIGYSQPERELFELAVTVIGYYDPEFRAFINPRISPSCGWSIFRAEDEMLRTTLSKKAQGDSGTANIGSLLSRDPGAVPVLLDVSEFTSTHMAIIASTGSGKSYLAGVIIEELMSPSNKACVLVVDPHGEYSTLQDMANTPDLAERRGVREYRPTARVFTPRDIKVKLSTLEFADLRYLLPNLSERMEELLKKAHDRMRDDQQRAWSLDELELAIGQIVDRSASDPAGVDYSGTASGLYWRLRSVLGKRPFSAAEHLDLRELLQPGQCTVLQLDDVDEKQQQVIVATLLRRIYRARQRTARDETRPGDEEYLPYPAFTLLEEAHHFAPAGGDAVTTGILKQVLAEGRKFGLGVGLISQRPGKLDADVLSQCMTQFIMKVVNPIDQNTIASAVESASRDILSELAALSKGQVIVTGNSTNAPVLCRVRERLTRHGGQSMDAPLEWNRWYDEDRVLVRERDLSVLHTAVRRGRNGLYED
ncbi:MAG: ATP-binding protein [Chloroflexota bacterium]|nr:ATP-binding protein [Chloroflexota bacterium]